MMKIKSFFVGILLLIIVFIMVILTALIYRANERSSIKTYIFQMGNIANERVGELQNINEIPQNELRNKLIKKYVSEFFKVIPGDLDVTNRHILIRLSTPDVFEKWKKENAKQIGEMSGKKMFRMARVSRIDTLDNTKDNMDYTAPATAEKIYYTVYYDTLTWTQSNTMNIEPLHDQGVINIEARFKPGIDPNINVRDYLESGQNPVGLFMFKVTNIGSKDIQ